MQTTKSLVDAYVVSEDGRMCRSIVGKSSEEIESIKKDIRDYESSSKCVLFQRLKERGVLKLIDYERDAENHVLGNDRSEHNGMLTLMDGLFDDECGRSAYYFFLPKTEEDIKDMAIYSKLQYDYCSGIDGEEHPYWRGTGKIAAGKTYIYQDNTECEFGRFISLDDFEAKVTKLVKFFSKAAKN